MWGAGWGRVRVRISEQVGGEAQFRFFSPFFQQLLSVFVSASQYIIYWEGFILYQVVQFSVVSFTLVRSITLKEFEENGMFFYVAASSQLSFHITCASSPGFVLKLISLV